MAFSINTNAGALVALQNLNKTNSMLENIQNQVNTGLKVSSAKDNSAVFAIAQKLRADVSGLNAAKQSIDRAQSALDIGMAAGEAVSDLLIEMKEKAVAASDNDLVSSSRNALNDEFTELRDQITSIVDNAEFNGINMVASGGSDISAIVNADASNKITISAQNLALGGGNVTITATENLSGTGSAAASTVASIDASIENVTSALSKMGAGSRRIGLQKEFVAKLSDAINVGIGNLVDADMAEVSAKLQATQVKQQLGLQALSIANQAPNSALSLFR